MNRDELLASTFLALADTLADDFDVLDFLQLLVDRAAEVMEAGAAGLILADQRGRLQLVASTSHAVELLELLALANERGPCVDAFRGGVEVVNVPPHQARARWPEFTASAGQVGFASVQVVPMRVRHHTLGALSLFFPQQTELTEDRLAVLRALASVATVGLLHERTPRQKEVLAQQMQSALTMRVVVEQAKGVVAELGGVRVDEAFVLINHYGHTHDRRLSEVARDVLAGRLDVDTLHGDEPSPDLHV